MTKVSYAREKFCGLMGFVIMLGKLSQFCFYVYDFSLTAKLISREKFCDSIKICENREIFLSCNFFSYGK